MNQNTDNNYQRDRSRSQSPEKSQYTGQPGNQDQFYQNNYNSQNPQNSMNQQFNRSNQLDSNQQYQQNYSQQNPQNQDSQSYDKDENGNMKIPLSVQFNFRHARRLYVGNIPDLIPQEYITQWLYRSIEACGGLLESGSPIIKVQIDSNMKFAFIEMRSIEEATAMLQLDGIILWNRALRIRRPTEYDKFPKVVGTRNIPKLDLSLLEGIGILIIPTQVEDSPNKIFLANLPNQLDEYTILENLKLRDHGELKAFHLVKDTYTNESKGFAFFEYKEPSITGLVIKALHGCQFFKRTLTCKRAIGDSNWPQKKGSQYKQSQNNNKNNSRGKGKYDRNNDSSKYDQDEDN